MLQVDHIYEFFFQNLFYDFGFCYPINGVIKSSPLTPFDISIFTRHHQPKFKIFFHDQEPVSEKLSTKYFEEFDLVNSTSVLVTSEKSRELDKILSSRNYNHLYYFFHGFAARDWYRGYQTLNFSKKVVKNYNKDFITYNRIIYSDRSYRIYFISKLIEQGLIDYGLISFAVADDDQRTYLTEINNPQTKLSAASIEHIKQFIPTLNKNLIIDNEKVPGSSSASIPITVDRIDYNNDTLNVDAFWHVVTETVFYYNKLHLTEKIFKPIVSKQPFILLAAPGNLEYLRSYGFKTFGHVIDESYDREPDNDRRIEKVVDQLKWYCNLSANEKTQIQQELESIVEYNFNHFYGEFQKIIASELITNCQTVLKQIGYDDSAIAYKELYRVITA